MRYRSIPILVIIAILLIAVPVAVVAKGGAKEPAVAAQGGAILYGGPIKVVDTNKIAYNYAVGYRANIDKSGNLWVFNQTNQPIAFFHAGMWTSTSYSDQVTLQGYN